MKAKDKRITAIKESITEVSPQQALDIQKDGGIILDVRDLEEVSQGSPFSACRISRSFLELKIEDAIPDLNQKVVVMCAGGIRSLFAADGIKKMGYENILSMKGGFNSWKNDGLPFEVPQMLEKSQRERYARHLNLSEVGEKGQLKLLNSKVLLIGAGGLGSPSSLYLAAAGVGTMGLMDHDVVDQSNLQRQILHTEASVGTAKVDSARERLTALNADIDIHTYQTRLDADNVEEIFSQYDVIVDGSDNLTTRYLVNDACVRMGKPNIHAAVYRFEGQITVFWPTSKHGGGCYRCMFPEPPSADMAPSCAEAGVLGVMPGTLGLLQAVETIKVILGIGKPLVGSMLYYDALRADFTTMKTRKNPDCKCCGANSSFAGYEEVAAVCASK